MKTKGSLYAHFNYLQIKKKVYNNRLIGSPLIVHAILKNVVLRKRALKFSDGSELYHQNYSDMDCKILRQYSLIIDPSIETNKKKSIL